MNESNLTVAEKYYSAMNRKDLATATQYLHPQAEFLSPFFEVKGKEKVVDAIKGFMQSFHTISIRAKFESEDQIMFVYDVTFPESAFTIRSAVLMNFKEHLIARIELFFDPRPFTEVK